MVWRYTNVYLYRLLFRSLPLHCSWLPDKVVWGTSTQSTAVASGTHPQPPHCHTPYKPTPPFSNHATFPSQSEMLPFHLSASTSSSSQPLTSKCATWFDLTPLSVSSFTTSTSHASPSSIHPSHSSKQHSATYLSHLPLITPWSYHHSCPATQMYAWPIAAAEWSEFSHGHIRTILFALDIPYDKPHLPPLMIR